MVTSFPRLWKLGFSFVIFSSKSPHFHRNFLILLFICFMISWMDAGVPHHLLGTLNPNVEFTAKDFRDSAIPVS